MQLTEVDAREVIRKGSKSFNLASSFFSSDHQRAASKLYHWCRYCDDLVDKKEMTDSEFVELVLRTNNIWDRPGITQEGPFKNMQEVVHRYGIPKSYALDLLEGMRMDLTGTNYKTIEDLKIYCYHVAGTVGLMMSHILGVFRAEALDLAVKMGLAMQLTNICRDVKEDFEMGRIYLPRHLLHLHNISEEDLLNVNTRSRLFQVVTEVIHESEKNYKEAKKGIADLPLRGAFVITFAARLYREINREILRRGERSLDHRVVVPTARKIWLLVISTAEVFCSMPLRLFNGKSVLKELPVWRRV